LRLSPATETLRERTLLLHRLLTASKPLVTAEQVRTGEKSRLPPDAFASPSVRRYRPLLDLRARPSPLTEHTTSLPSSSTPRETHRGRNRRKETSPTASSLILASHRLHERRVVVGRNSRRGEGTLLSLPRRPSLSFLLLCGDTAILQHPSRPLFSLPPSLVAVLSLPLPRATSTATHRRRVDGGLLLMLFWLWREDRQGVRLKRALRRRRSRR
jgi:hypothetical protein